MPTYSQPADHRGWYHTRKLPHFDAFGALQLITFRLADSLPAVKLRQIENDLCNTPASGQEAERRKQIEYWLDRGIGCCALANSEVAAVFRDGLLLHDRQRYHLLAWCIMPNHVHILIECQYSLSRIVQSWKAFSGRWAVAHNERLALGLPAGQLWMKGYWDRFIRDEDHLHAAVYYIHHNPVEAGLCDAPESWQWSSA